MGIAVLGFVVALFRILQHEGPTIEVGPWHVTKRVAVLGLVIWTAVGLPLLAYWMFGVARFDR